MRTALLTIVLSCGPIVAACGAEVTLREQATISGSVLRLSDVADVEPSLDESVDELAATPLMPAPTDGSGLFLQSSEIRDLLAARGVNVRLVRLLGAQTVQIGGGRPSAKQESPGTPHTGVAASATLSLEDCILAYVRQQSGHQNWTVEVADEDQLAFAGPVRGGALIVSGGKEPWTGFQRFRISRPGEARGASITVRVDRVETIAVARRAIERGDLIGAADVEIRSHVGAVPSQAANSLDVLVGQEAVQAIRPGAMVLTNQVRAPYVVRRGERVSIRARAAGVSARTFATAEQDGSIGDLVMVQSLTNKERYAARVSGVRELEVFTAGTAVNDVAASTVRK